MITNLEARKIASDWHTGQASPMYALASTGAFVPFLLREIEREVADCLKAGNPESDRLLDLYAYVLESTGGDERGPVEGWSDLKW